MSLKRPGTTYYQSLKDSPLTKCHLTSNGPMAQPTVGSLFNLIGLPKELQRDILIKMDCYSLRNLLHSSPQLCKLFVIVVDAPDNVGEVPTSQFFGCMEGLTVVPFAGDCSPRNHSKFLIKIFEFRVDPSSILYATFAQKDDGSSKKFDFIDRWTIALLHINTWHHKPETTLTQSFKERCAMVYIENSVFQSSAADFQYRPRDPLDISFFQERLSESYIKGAQITFLKSLDLRDVYHVQHIHFPCLKDASIQFKNGSSEDLPTLHDFRAPALRCFKVLYNDQLPIFTDIRLTDDQFENPENNSYNIPANDSYFSLCRIASLEDSLTCALPPCQHNLGTMNSGTLGNRSWSFTKNFSRIHVSGGPDKILELLSLQTASMLIWKKTDLAPTLHDQISSGVTLRINSIFHGDVVLHIETTVPYTVLPKFSFYAVNICGLIVVDRACGLEDNGLLSTDPGLLSYMKYLEVHSPIAPVSKRPNTECALVIPATLLSNRGFTSLERVRMSGVLLDPCINRERPGTRMGKGRPRFSGMRGPTWEYDSSKEFAQSFSRSAGARNIQYIGFRGIIMADDRGARIHLARAT